MTFQGFIVLLCVVAAALFMLRKIYRTLTRKNACNCSSSCKGQCYSGGQCPEGKQLKELRPRR